MTDPTPTPVAPEIPKRENCAHCGRDYPIWYAPSPLWNAVMRRPDVNLEDLGFCCPDCFIRFADKTEIGPKFWFVGSSADDGSRYCCLACVANPANNKPGGTHSAFCLMATPTVDELQALLDAERSRTQALEAEMGELREIEVAYGKSVAEDAQEHRRLKAWVVALLRYPKMAREAVSAFHEPGQAWPFVFPSGDEDCCPDCGGSWDDADHPVVSDQSGERESICRFSLNSIPARTEATDAKPK